jgi:hypothetical protein
MAARLLRKLRIELVPLKSRSKNRRFVNEVKGGRIQDLTIRPEKKIRGSVKGDLVSG